jgi:Tol biopolymer transport system component
VLITSEANVVFAHPSNVLFIRNRTLMSQAFDPASKLLIGDPRPMMVNVGYVPRLALGDFSYSKAGILTTGGGRSVNRQYAWFDRNGKQSGSACPPGNYFDIALSPDGDRAAIQRSDVQTGNSDIWIVDLQRSLISRLTFEPAVEDDPVWSADGKDVYYSNAKEGTYNIYRKASNGVGSPEVVTRPGTPQRPADWSRDGKYLLFEVDAPRAGYDIWVLPADTTEKPFPFLATSFTEQYPRFSPDGNWVAYASDESGRSEIYVQSFPLSGGRWQVSTSGGSQPRWRQDGRELFYVSSDLMLMAVEIGAGSKFEYGQAAPLFKTRIDDFSAPSRYVPVQNGQKFLINIPVDEELANPITVSIFPFGDGAGRR